VFVDGGRPAEDGSAEWQSVMRDVSGLSLSAIADASLDRPASDGPITDGDDSPLALSLRRLADELTHPGEPIAGFNSAL
jgi:FXSXX-COOH protein